MTEIIKAVWWFFYKRIPYILSQKRKVTILDLGKYRTVNIDRIYEAFRQRGLVLATIEYLEGIIPSDLKIWSDRGLIYKKLTDEDHIVALGTEANKRFNDEIAPRLAIPVLHQGGIYWLEKQVRWPSKYKFLAVKKKQKT